MRADCVRRALEESENIALRNLQGKLGSIHIEAVWPILRSVCHDMALYLGGGAIAGGAVGGGLGFLVFGGGAVYGAAAGSVIGVKMAAALLGFLGLKSVIQYMLENIPRAIGEYQVGFKYAWGRVPDLCDRSGPHYGAEIHVYGFTSSAAASFARGHEIIVLAMLMGIVTYLTRNRGNLTTLLTEARQSARLGPKFEDWLATNAEKLGKLPLLQASNKNNGGGPAIAGMSDRTTTRVVERYEPPKRPAKRPLRAQGDLIGKAEGGPGTWQISPKRSKGEAYQEQVTGVERGIEYYLPKPGSNAKQIAFDGYDAERKVLLDAKDWKGFPPRDADFWKHEVVEQARDQLKAAGGAPIEWHFSTVEAKQTVMSLFEQRQVSGIKLVVTPQKL